MEKIRDVLLVTTLFYISLISSGCSPVVTDPSVSDTSATIPRTMPSIIGQVTAVNLPTIVVEEKPTEPHGSPKARVKTTNETKVFVRDGGVVSGAELHVGQQVKVWFTGPVMESYPVQATAGVILIEQNSR